MARLFVALGMPERAREALVGLRFEGEGIRWVPESQIHLTLRFIGEVGPAPIEEARASLRLVDASPFTIALKGVGHFPKHRANVLWAGVHPAEDVARLAGKVEEALSCSRPSLEGSYDRSPEKSSRGGGDAERLFSAHVTIARLRNASPALVRRFLRDHASFECAPFSVGAFSLYSSVLAGTGARHEIIETYPLNGTGAGGT